MPGIFNDRRLQLAQPVESRAKILRQIDHDHERVTRLVRTGTECHAY